MADGHYSYHEQAVTAMAHACVGEHVFFLQNTDFEMFLLSLSLLLKSLLFFWIATMRNAQTKIAIVYMREQSCDTRDDMMIPI